MARKLVLLSACAALAFTLSGCGSDSGSSAPTAPAVALSGTAATGAPIASAAIAIRCASGSEITTMTNAAGEYTVTVDTMTAAGAVMPCALQITLPGDASPGVPYLYGLAEANGTANITPLTGLAVTQAINAAAGVSAGDWFAGTTLTFPTAEQIAAARTAIETALQTATGEAAVPFNIFTTSFAADSTSDYDVWLDRFNQALVTAGTNYSALMAAFVSGGGFGSITIDVTPVTGGGGTMQVTVSVSGVAGQTVTITGVPQPANEGEFCNSSVLQGYIYQGDGATVTINSCSFSGNTGTISATVLITTPVTMSIPYSATYTWL